MNAKWFWRLYRLAKVQRCYTKQPDEHAFQNVMTCSQSEIELVTSSNIMLHITTGTVNGFFAIIYQHRDIESYLEQVVRDYFSFICKDKRFARSDQETILKELAIPENRNKFWKMGSVWYSDSPISQFLRTENPGVIGLENYPSDKAAIDRLRTFVRKYASGAIGSYRQNALTKKNQWQTTCTNRTLAVEALAKTLGLSHMIPHAEYRTLIVDGQYRYFGLYMECAEGQDVTQIPGMKRQQILSPQLQCELNRLNMLDTLTGEIDHCPENYFVVVTGEHAVGINVFDNSSELNFPIQWNVSFETLLKCSPYIDADGYINRPYINAELANRLREISFKELYHALSPYLACVPVASLYIRVRRCRRAIQKSLRAGIVCAKAQDEWNEETLQEELRQTNLRTYLHSFLCDCIHA